MARGDRPRASRPATKRASQGVAKVAQDTTAAFHFKDNVRAWNYSSAYKRFLQENLSRKESFADLIQRSRYVEALAVFDIVDSHSENFVAQFRSFAETIGISDRDFGRMLLDLKRFGHIHSRFVSYMDSSEYWAALKGETAPSKEGAPTPKDVARDDAYEALSKAPSTPPVLWAAGRIGKETPVSFIQRTYSEWLGKGLVRADIKRLDRPLYDALNYWLKSHSAEGFDLPDGKGGRPASTSDDIGLWVTRVREAEAAGREICLPADVKFISRLARALSRPAEKG